MNVTEAQRFDLNYLLRSIIAEVHKTVNVGLWCEDTQAHLRHIESLANGAIEIIKTARNTKDVG